MKHEPVSSMSSFLDRLKKKDVIPSTPGDVKQETVVVQNTPAVPVAAAPPAEQLRVDIFQTQTALLVYAQIAGASVNDYDVMIEGDNDIVTIEGTRTRPNGEYFSTGTEGKEHVLEECSWGRFYRQIILPAEVDPEQAEAKMKEGVLMLLLPLKKSGGKGVRIKITELPGVAQR